MRMNFIFLITALIFAGTAHGVASAGAGRVVAVSDEAGFVAAVKAAEPGDDIVLSAGNYAFKRIRFSRSGALARPITVRAKKRGSVRIKARGVVLFDVRGANWVFENLDIRGHCVPQKKCEHAFQLNGDADNVVIRNNRMRDFNASIKSGGGVVEMANGEKVRKFPDNVVIEGNAIYNTRPRRTSAPVTLIDVVGGRNWVVRRNLIADFEKAGGNKISYAMFLKGNSHNGVIEQNLVVCEWRHTGGIRLGLSLGGGGTGKKFCKNQDCRVEHTNGILRNNIVLNCPRDVAVYLNKAKGSKIYNNTFLNTGGGVDVMYKGSSADTRNNIISGSVRDRRGGVHTASRNLNMRDVSRVEPIFRDPGKADFSLLDGLKIIDKASRLEDVTDDFCGNPRGPGKPDLGAIEFGDTACDPSAMLRAAENYGPR